MSKEDTIKCFLDCKGEGNGFRLTLTNKDIDVIANEIERLNNIINELEEEINFKIKGIEIKFNSYEELCKNAGNFGGYINLKSIKDKLQELKGSDK